jgi:hypothetical protein
MTFHNMRAFCRADPASLEAGRTFDAWLARTISAQSHFAGDLLGYPVSGWTFTPALRSAPVLA